MKTPLKIPLTCLLLLAALFLAACASVPIKESAAAPGPAAVKALTKKVADWQIATFDEVKKYRALSSGRQARVDAGEAEVRDHHLADWHYGALYTGYDEWSEIADDPSTYLNFLKGVLAPYEWGIYGEEIYDNIYHADTHLVGLTYLSLYEAFADPAMIGPLRETFDQILANPQDASLEYFRRNSGKVRGHLLRWGWCDALFMAPPVWARLARVTGEAKYLEFMDQEYRLTHDVLWSEEHQLFYRDTRFFDRVEANGRSVFWSRGNGWVFGGLALMIPDLPNDWESRAFYTETFQQMADALKDLQRTDGTWSMGLLGDEADFPVKETSGTAFITYGMAWGVNNGLLDPEVYQPVIYKAWAALADVVTDEGLFGFVQPVGSAPGDAFPDKTEVYGIGAFLLAGTEVYKMVAHDAGLTPEVKTADLPEPTTFMENGGWCWFQDPRAVIHDDQLFIGAVQGNGSGPALAGVYDLAAEQPLGRVILQDNFQGDDHNAPVFHLRPDGSVLAAYARHGRDTFHFFRISDPENPLAWGDEYRKEYPYTDPADDVTYMNLYELEDEGRLYNFFRGLGRNPTYSLSTDQGLSWSGPVKFFEDEVGGRQRPYVRYASNGTDTIYVTATDAHPRRFGNNIYYFEFRGGNYYRADGTRIKNLEKEGPLRTSEAELVYVGSEKVGSGPGGRPSNAAWTSSIVIDAEGHPHLGYSVHLSPDDLRYRVASWDGSRWIDREVARAGKCLYLKETSYTGLITLDPEDPTSVYISTDVHPSTGVDCGGPHEIYTAQIGPEDSIATIDWQPITANSPVGNIRPIIATGEGDRKVLLWMSGDYYNYQHYNVDVKGLVLED